MYDLGSNSVTVQLLLQMLLEPHQPYLSQVQKNSIVILMNFSGYHCGLKSRFWLFLFFFFQSPLYCKLGLRGRQYTGHREEPRPRKRQGSRGAAAHSRPKARGSRGGPWPKVWLGHKSEVAQSCLTLSNPMDCSLPGSSVHGIFQARVLEWGAIAFSWLFLLTLFFYTT